MHALFYHVYAEDNDATEAEAAIERAESLLASSYLAVLEAESAGANISSLLVQLNQGVELLAEARNFHRNDNFDQAVDFANKSYTVSTGVETEADELRDSAVFNRKQRLLVAFAESTFAIGVVIFGSLWCWRFFRKKYCERVLKMKPEVVESES